MESKLRKKAKHPTQPLIWDTKMADARVLRFKPNKIVQFLLDHNGKFGLNELACMDFSREDRQQFAQLIGYSLQGYGDLSYVTDAAWNRAQIEGKKP